MYEEDSHSFTTPRGNPVKMFYRKDTNDWNTLFASMNEDEYGLALFPLLAGTALDIGAYLGSVGIGLAIDNPDLRVICIEPVPANITLILKNIRENGLDERVRLIPGAAGGPDDRQAVIKFGYTGESHLEHHAFVGNITLVHEYGDRPHEEVIATCYSLTQLMKLYGVERLALLKIDCEGCEWCTLADPAVQLIDAIVGEWHLANQPGQEVLAALLPNHHVTFSGPTIGAGEFRAVHKGV